MFLSGNLEMKKIVEKMTKEERRAYYQAHKEEKRAYHKNYYQANKKKIADSAKKSYKANKKKIAAYQKAYRETHREEIKARTKAYYQANKEIVAASAKKHRKTEVSLQHLENFVDEFRLTNDFFKYKSFKTLLTTFLKNGSQKNILKSYKDNPRDKKKLYHIACSQLNFHLQKNSQPGQYDFY